VTGWPEDPLLPDAREALREAGARLVDLIHAVEQPSASAIGTWSVADVAAHLTHALTLDRDALAGAVLPHTIVDERSMAQLNDQLLRSDPERDPPALAARVAHLIAEIDVAAQHHQGGTVAWLGSAQLAPSAVVCHALEECLMHGHDIAKAARLRWPIERRHALLALEAGVFPLMSALPPEAMVDPSKAANLRLTVDVRILGGGRINMCLTDGRLELKPPTRRPDAHLVTDPADLMLTFLGRQGIARPIARGRLVAWGRRAWLLPRLLGALSPP
jgi:hypothetical protein